VVSPSPRFLCTYGVRLDNLVLQPNSYIVTTMTGTDGDSLPLFLLKTKSSPNDGYEEQFAAAKEGISFEPIFVPVLEHQLLEIGLTKVREFLENKSIGREATSKYGGLIFTSQRAVEAFAKVVEEGKGARPQLMLQH
jgi:uroporphyrinogen-III synthase